MWSDNEAREASGKTVHSENGDKIGKVGQVFLDDRTGQPEFFTVNTGLFGTSESFVPVEGSTVTGDGISIPHGKDKVKDAPRIDLDGDHLDEADERRLFEHYGRSYGGDDLDSTTQTQATQTRTAGGGTGGGIGGGDVTAGRTDEVTGGDTGHVTPAGHDTSGPTTDDAMTRSEEHLEVGTTSEAAGRARLRKYVTTEQESVTVPVRKERAVLETEPVTGDNLDNATSGPAISEEEHEVVLNEERVVVEKDVQPVERVRLGTETVTEQETVNEEVRKEHIDVDGDVEQRDR